MKTPEQILKKVTQSVTISGTEHPSIVMWDTALQAILAYHAQFTVTSSDRERMIAEGFATYVENLYDKEKDGWYGPFDIMPVSIQKVFDGYVLSDAYKAIPPAPTIRVIPTREEAKREARRVYINAFESELRKYAFMDCYDWLCERLGGINETKEDGKCG